MAPKLPGLVKSNSANQREESIYRVAPLDPAICAPRVRTYNIQPATPTAGGGAMPIGNLPKMHADSSQVQSILHPVQGPRDVQVRAGVKPPNHARSNIAAVKEQSSLNNLRKQAEQQHHASHAQARSSSAPQRRPQPRQSSGDGGGGRDFVRENRVGAAAPGRPPRPELKQDDGMKYLQKKDFGRVPSYLLERKIEMAEKHEADLRAKEASRIPPGMRLLPEEERMETLAMLQRNKQEVERAIQALPIVIETPSQIRRRDDLEQRLRDIEEGLKVFARSKVLVRL